MMTLPRDQFVGVKMTAIEICALRRAARKSGATLSDFIRTLIDRAVREPEPQ
jgi:hypothetical protein